MSLRGATAATDPLVSGVTVRGMTADYYGFVQTWGPATVLADGAGISKGDEVSLSDGVTGAFQLQDAWTEQRVGVALFAPDDTTYGGVFLQIMP